MTDRELVYQLRWMCELAAAMGQTQVPLGALREIVDRFDGPAVTPVSLDAWRKGKK